MGKSIGKNISKKLAGKYRQKSSFLTASIKAIRKTAEVNDDLVVNKFANHRNLKKIHNKEIQRQL